MAYTTINDPSAHFQVMTWTGAGSSYPRDLTYTGNSNLKPDMLWGFGRSNTGSNWILDSSRGFTANKELVADQGLVEGDTNAINSGSYGWIGPGLTNGHQLSQAGNYWNVADRTYYSFGWKGNGGTKVTVAESGSGSGCVNACTHQANTTAGFSIITYTGRDDELSNAQESKLTHGLGVAPTFTIMKRRSGATGSWFVISKHITATSAYGNNEYLNFDNYNNVNGNSYTGDTAPDSTYIYLGNELVNIADAEYVCYAFTDVQGYSKFGEYLGNANANGTFVYTGFKPAMILVKARAAGASWRVMNSGTSPTNPADAAHVVESNSEADVTGSTVYCDFLSNGFKHRASGLSNAASNFIYMAFAEQPFVTSTGTPTTAR